MFRFDSRRVAVVVSWSLGSGMVHLDVLCGFGTEVRPPALAAALGLLDAGRLAQCSAGLRDTEPVLALVRARPAVLRDAIEKKAPLAVVQALLAADPEAAKLADKNGELPLDIALRNNAPLEVAQALGAANPEASKHGSKTDVLLLCKCSTFGRH